MGIQCSHGFLLIALIIVPPIPIFGGGDCYSSQDYWADVEKANVDGVMIARGALIKPWIFTEVKERREWDISARERLDLIRTVSYSFLSSNESVLNFYFSSMLSMV